MIATITHIHIALWVLPAVRVILQILAKQGEPVCPHAQIQPK
jgi:hypothetical protein